MIQGLSPETASSLALALPRHVPRHRDLRGGCPGHDPLRREGRGSYQPRSNPLPLPLGSRRFKRLSAFPSAPTWRRGPRRGVLEWPRGPRRPRRLRGTRSLTGVVVPGREAVLRRIHANAGGQGCALSIQFTHTYQLLPRPPLLLTPRIYFLSRSSVALQHVLQKPLAARVGCRRAPPFASVLRGQVPARWFSCVCNSGLTAPFFTALTFLRATSAFHDLC